MVSAVCGSLIATACAVAHRAEAVHFLRTGIAADAGRKIGAVHGGSGSDAPPARRTRRSRLVLPRGARARDRPRGCGHRDDEQPQLVLRQPAPAAGPELLDGDPGQLLHGDHGRGHRRVRRGAGRRHPEGRRPLLDLLPDLDSGESVRAGVLVRRRRSWSCRRTRRSTPRGRSGASGSRGTRTRSWSSRAGRGTRSDPAVPTARPRRGRRSTTRVRCRSGSVRSRAGSSSRSSSP